MKYLHLCDWHGCDDFGWYTVRAFSFQNDEEALEMYACLDHTREVTDAANRELNDPGGPGGFVEVIYPKVEGVAF